MFNELKSDFPASIIVFFVAIPLCLGIALASGAPLFAGLIAGMIGGVIVGSISGSALGVSGPAAGLTVIVLSAIQDLGSYEGFLIAVILAGIMQLVLGIVKAGFIGYFFPSSVIKGMLSGIGLIIILKQIPHAVGYDNNYEGDLSFIQLNGENTFSNLYKSLEFFSPQVVLVALVSLLILILWERVLMKKAKVFTLFQGPLAAVAFGILYVYITANYLPSWSISKEHLVNVPVASNFSSFLEQFSLPDFSFFANQKVYTIAFTMAIVASLETLLSVEATDKLDPQKRVTPTNRELIAQGTGNIISGLIGGLPITQVIVRSSANIQSGGKTKTSAVLHGVLILISVIFIPKLLNKIPLSVLASILFVVGYKLAKPSLVFKMYQLGNRQFIPFMVTMIGIVFTDLLTGIALGVAVAIFNLMRVSYKNSHFMKINASEGDSTFVEIKLAEEVTFLNKGAIRQELDKLPEGSHVVIDMRESFKVDYDVYEIIENFRKNSAPNRNIKVEVRRHSKYPTADY